MTGLALNICSVMFKTAFSSGEHPQPRIVLGLVFVTTVLQEVQLSALMGGDQFYQLTCLVKRAFLLMQTGDILIIVGTGEAKKVGVELDSINLSIFSHRYFLISPILDLKRAFLKVVVVVSMELFALHDNSALSNPGFNSCRCRYPLQLAEANQKQLQAMREEVDS